MSIDTDFSTSPSARRNGPSPGPGAARASSAGAGPTRSAARGPRRRRLPWVALGGLIFTMSVLGFALWTVEQGVRTPVLVAGSDIQPGQVIGRGDLEVVNVGADPGLSLLAVGSEGEVVGAVARGPIPAGTPLSAALVAAPGSAVPPGHAVVGALLEPGQYPVSSLQTGDQVRLVRSADQLAPGDGGASDLGPATVWMVEQADGISNRQLLVAVLVEEPVAVNVAAAASDDRLRLLLTRGES